MFSNLFSQKFNDVISAVVKEAIYHKLEYECHTNITDEDMLKMHIDFALENGDNKQFMKLSKQLKEVTINGK